MRAHIKNFLTINTSNVMRDESKVHDDFYMKTKTTTVYPLTCTICPREMLKSFKTKIEQILKKNESDNYITRQINE